MKSSLFLAAVLTVLLTVLPNDSFAASRCDHAERKVTRLCSGLSITGSRATLSKRPMKKSVRIKLRKKVQACNQALAKKERLCSSPDESTNEKNPIFCLQVYQPVCGSIEGELFSYPNLCSLEANGAQFVSDGECSDKFATYVQ